MQWEDINWMNCFYKRQGRIILNIFFRFLIVVILLFLTTPTAFMQMIQNRNKKDSQEFTQSNYKEDEDYTVNFFIKSFLPPLIIILINRLILLIIFQLSTLKSKVGKSFPFFELPRKYFESCIFLHFLQHVAGTRTCCASWNQFVRNY